MNKIRIIEKHINGILDIKEVCELLSCSERTIYRMKKKFKSLGPPGLIHGLKGKPSNHQGDNTKYADICRIVTKNSKYHDFGSTLLSQHLEQKYWISINKETLRQIMIRAGIRVPKPKRKKIIRKKRKRCAQYGAMIQFDGSYHNWFENGESPCLLCAVDDATARVYAQFSKSESFEEVFAFWEKFRKNHYNSQLSHSKLTEQEKRDLERYFSKEVVRTVKNDGTVQYKHKTYQLKKGLILKSKLITVKESIYGNVRLYDGTDCLRGTEPQ